MVLIEDTFWPLVVVGVRGGSDTSRVHPDCQWRPLRVGVPLLLALIVPGIGTRGHKALKELSEWLREHGAVIHHRVARVAWIIEDGSLRRYAASVLTAAQCSAAVATFATPTSAIPWLVDAHQSPSASREDVDEVMPVIAGTCSRDQRERAVTPMRWEGQSSTGCGGIRWTTRTLSPDRPMSRVNARGASLPRSQGSLSDQPQ